MKQAGAAGWKIEAPPVAIAAHLARLHGLCFAPLPETPWPESAFRTILGLSTTFARFAHQDGDDASALLVCRLSGEEAEILTLCVAPEARRSGLARGLLDVCIRHVGPQTRIVLEVAVNNAPAIALYESAGFRPAGLRPDYYSGGSRRVDALVYARGADTA
ncbi:MAG: GNAT family N-acetyltransferase [Alphaproteobacteria bacterium]